MAQEDVTTNEIMDFLREHMPLKEETATKEEMRELQQEFRYELKQELSHYATRDDLVALKSEILSAVDALAKHNQLFEQELVAMRMRYERHEDRLEVVEQKLGVATA